MNIFKISIVCLFFCFVCTFVQVPTGYSKTPTQIRAEHAAKKEAKRLACLELAEKQKKELEGANQLTINAHKPYHKKEKLDLNCNPKKAPKTKVEVAPKETHASSVAPIEKAPKETMDRPTREAIEKFERQVAP